MKKQIISWGLMLAAAFTLTNCAQELDNPVGPGTEGSPFKIIASTTHSKTVNDGMDTNWSEGDAMNVFHAVGETTEYVNDGEFKLVDKNNGLFEGTLGTTLDPQEEYDWFAFYPYSDYIKTPVITTSGYMVVGSKYNGVQTQTGNNSKAHIAGENYPIAGFATAVSPAKTPKLEMSHVSSLIAVNVTNSTDEPLVVDEIVFTAPVEVVGTYYINFTDKITPASFEGSGDDYVSKSATLKVNDGAEIAVGASAKFYLAVKPFTASADDILTIKVNKCVKEHKLANIVTFSAGKIKTLNFDYDYVASAEPEQPAGEKTVTISFANTTQRTAYSTNEQKWENDGVVFINSKGSSTSNIGDYSNPARFYKSSNITVTAPGNITKLEFNCDGLETKYVTPLTELDAPDGTSTTVTYMTLSAQARAYSLTVTYVIADPTAPSITANNVSDVSARGVENAELTYSVANLEYDDLTVTYDGTIVTSAEKGEDGTITYTVAANNTDASRIGTILIAAGDEATKEVSISQNAPEFKVSRNSVELKATAESKTEITVTSDFDWTLSAEGSGYTVTPKSYTWSEEGKQTITITATSDRTEEGVATLGTITIKNSVTNQTLSVDVTQATSFVPEGGDGEGGEGKTVEATLSFADKAQRTTYTTTQQVWEQNGIKLINDKSSSTTNVADYAKPARFYANSKITVEAPGQITKIVFDANSSSYATAMKNSIGTVSGATVTVSSDKVTVAFTSPVGSFVVAKLTAQVRMDSITVTYLN